MQELATDGKRLATELERRIGNRDQTAGRELVEALDKEMRRFMHFKFKSMPCEDRDWLVIELLTDLLKGKAAYDPARASLKYFATFCLRNRANDWFDHRKPGQKTHKEFLEDYVRHTEALNAGVEEPGIERQEIVDVVTRALKGLSANERSAALAYMKYGRRYCKFLAREENISESAAAKRWERAKKTLQEKLRKAYGEQLTVKDEGDSDED